MVLAKAALGLKVAELLQGFFELAGEGLLEQAEGGQGVCVIGGSLSDGARRVRFRVASGPAASGFGLPERQEVGFDGAGAVLSRAVSDGLHQLLFKRALGLEVGEELLREILIGG